jgi:hypothetical protein
VDFAGTDLFTSGSGAFTAQRHAGKQAAARIEKVDTAAAAVTRFRRPTVMPG